MGFTEILTIIFIVLKLLGVITWAWWVCLLPEIIAGVLYVIVVVAQLVAIYKTHKSIKKHFDEFEGGVSHGCSHWSCLLSGRLDCWYRWYCRYCYQGGR